MTIWHGNQNIRLQCNAAVRAHANPGPGLPNPNPIPNHPYITADKNTAMATGTMPPARQATGRGAHRQGHGAQIVAPAPPPQHPPAQHIALPQVPVQAPNNQSQVPQIHASQAQQHISVAQQPYDDKAPFDFWPQLPWDAEPDATGWPDPVKITDQVRRAEEGDRWKDLPPHQWPVGDESRWQGVRFLAAGGYGSAGLYVEVENGSIKDVSTNYILKIVKFLEILTNTHYDSEWSSRKRVCHVGYGGTLRIGGRGYRARSLCTGLLTIGENSLAVDLSAILFATEATG